MRSALVFAAVALSAFAAPTWHIVNNDIATIDTGLAFISATVGYTGGVGNGVGPEVLKTTDGGVTWTPCPAQFGLDIILLDTDATENSIVVSSVFGELYSDDSGATFSQSVGGGQSQSVRYLGANGDGGLKYGVTGIYGLQGTNGVGLSVDGGKTFKVYDANLQTLERYGAFPTDTTWYVSAGDWPTGADDDAVSAKGYTGMSYARSKPFGPKGTPGQGYQAQITKTTDGGATFTSVYNVSDQFYFNGIDCQPSNENACCAVAEADNDSPTPGAQILCTLDGGKTWTQNLYAAGTSTQLYSLLEIRFVSDTEAWAVGGTLTVIEPSAWFLHSTDGGKTWQEAPVSMKGYYAMSVSVVDASHVFSSLLNPITQEAAVAAYE